MPKPRRFTNRKAIVQAMPRGEPRHDQRHLRAAMGTAKKTTFPSQLATGPTTHLWFSSRFICGGLWFIGTCQTEQNRVLVIERNAPLVLFVPNCARGYCERGAPAPTLSATDFSHEVV